MKKAGEKAEEKVGGKTERRTGKRWEARGGFLKSNVGLEQIRKGMQRHGNQFFMMVMNDLVERTRYRNPKARPENSKNPSAEPLFFKIENNFKSANNP